ncbi:hypothetical protein LTR36_003004 [Oleoguttula mirabilis]|uniref:C6 transcription factor n=1 Tax=Oleoguttula mirabilis TaxID=1507867 RepID=A0AAV9JWA6_9PEZI|nr:hypothetical protein LTR36_003004 [Oleoguttula mirabilis]
MFPQGDHVMVSSPPHTPFPPGEQACRDRETVLSGWIGITKLLTTATHMFFASKSATKQMLTSYRYLDLLEHFQPLLAKWHTEFIVASPATIAGPTRQILLIEYYYVRVFISSIAIQALVEHVSQRSSDGVWLDQDFLRKQYAQDFRFINDVRESSGEILTAARKLNDDGFLRYCPVRLFLRIVAASIFLLKAISLGAREADANASLDQLDRCIEALTCNRADDIHLSGRYAELIARHVRRFKRNLRSRASGQPFKQPAASEANPSAAANGASSSGTAQGGQHHHVPTQSHALEGGVANLPFTNAADTGGGFDLGSHGADASMDDWLAQPFDPQVAPFSMVTMQPASGLAPDSLDFLWNMQGL